MTSWGLRCGLFLPPDLHDPFGRKWQLLIKRYRESNSGTGPNRLGAFQAVFKCWQFSEHPAQKEEDATRAKPRERYAEVIKLKRAPDNVLPRCKIATCSGGV